MIQEMGVKDKHLIETPLGLGKKNGIPPGFTMGRVGRDFADFDWDKPKVHSYLDPATEKK